MVVVEYVRKSQTLVRERSARDELRASPFTDANAVLLAHPMVDRSSSSQEGPFFSFNSLMCRRKESGRCLL